MMRAALALLVALWLGPSAQPGSVLPPDAVDRAQVLSDLRVLSADDMQGRQVGTPGGEKARAHVVERLKASGAQPIGESWEHPFTYAGRARGGGAPVEVRGVNVLGRIDGSRRTDRFIVVSAHYDHVGVRNGVVYNGADDNASGTAALFAVAKYFAANRPAHSLILAAFDAEESGLRGAREFVQRPPVDRSALALNLNMDMIGRDPDNTLYVVGTYRQPYLKPIVGRLATRAGRLPIKLVMGHDDPTQVNPANRRTEDWTRQSDHWAFMDAQIPALYFGVEDFANHHRDSDDYETMTHDFYVRAVQTMILAVQEFDASLDEVMRGRGGLRQ